MPPAIILITACLSLALFHESSTLIGLFRLRTDDEFFIDTGSVMNGLNAGVWSLSDI